MKLIINLSNNLVGGGLQVALSFLSECRHFDQNEYHVILSPNVARQVDRSLFGGNFFFTDIPSVPFWKLERILPSIEKKISPDVVFTVFGPSYWRPKTKHLEGFAIGHYIYPESPFWRKLSTLKRIKSFLYKQIKSYYFKKDADYYVVETDDVNKRLRILLNTDKVYTVSNTCSAHYHNPNCYISHLPPRMPQEFRLLTISSYYPHKNLEIIPKILDVLKDFSGEKHISFVLTLRAEDYQRVIPPQYRESVYNIGPVLVNEGPSLYQETDAMFLPTLLECFSVSYPEAMAMKRPIITSDLDFAHSICENAALYFNPLNPVDAAEKIIKLAEDVLLQKQLTEKGEKRLTAFPSAKKRAECYLELCKKVLDEKQ